MTAEPDSCMMQVPKEKKTEVPEMSGYRDPTAEAAVGTVSREWRQMVRRAIALRKTARELTPEEQKLFTGIYRRLLSEPEPELEKMKEKGA